MLPPEFYFGKAPRPKIKVPKLVLEGENGELLPAPSGAGKTASLVEGLLKPLTPAAPKLAQLVASPAAKEAASKAKSLLKEGAELAKGLLTEKPPARKTSPAKPSKPKTEPKSPGEKPAPPTEPEKEQDLVIEGPEWSSDVTPEGYIPVGPFRRDLGGDLYTAYADTSAASYKNTDMMVDLLQATAKTESNYKVNAHADEGGGRYSTGLYQFLNTTIPWVSEKKSLLGSTLETELSVAEDLADGDLRIVLSSYPIQNLYALIFLRLFGKYAQSRGAVISTWNWNAVLDEADKPVLDYCTAQAAKYANVKPLDALLRLYWSASSINGVRGLAGTAAGDKRLSRFLPNLKFIRSQNYPD